jgi:hypothetical protein
MTRFYEPDLSADPNSPFIRDAGRNAVAPIGWIWTIARSYWVMVGGIGSHLTIDEKRAHLADLRREHLIERSAFRKFFRLSGRFLADQ